MKSPYTHEQMAAVTSTFSKVDCQKMSEDVALQALSGRKLPRVFKEARKVGVQDLGAHTYHLAQAVAAQYIEYLLRNDAEGTKNRKKDLAIKDVSSRQDVTSAANKLKEYLGTHLGREIVTSIYKKVDQRLAKFLQLDELDQGREQNSR